MCTATQDLGARGGSGALLLSAEALPCPCCLAVCPSVYTETVLAQNLLSGLVLNFFFIYLFLSFRCTKV
jgi:hypothetical protein